MLSLSLNMGHLIVGLTALFFVLAGYAVLASAVQSHRQGSSLLDVLAQDTHYKYFALFLIPTSAYFVIANWVGWQYYQNS
ncbi:hypothetical protein F5141DRAFT_1004572 [Pisolithus sp. B1]|nr:hypothetical protein F5141DRAFT_1004572 [Pisolithus sp. B1]